MWHMQNKSADIKVGQYKLPTQFSANSILSNVKDFLKAY